MAVGGTIHEGRCKGKEITAQQEERQDRYRGRKTGKSFTENELYYLARHGCVNLKTTPRKIHLLSRKASLKTATSGA